MTSLDMRATQASASLRHAVAGHHTALGVERLARRRLVNQAVSAAMAMAAIAALLGIALMLKEALPSASVSTSPPTSAVTTTISQQIDGPAPPVVEHGGGGGDRPVTTTTTPVTTTTTSTTTTTTATTTTTFAPDTEPPRLVVLSPEDGAHLHEKTVRFSGETEPGATVRAGRYEADVTDEGAWSIVLVLEKGANRATFTATDEAGHESTASIVVYLDPADEPPVDHEFTAHAEFGSCSESPPFDVYYGTAIPGSVINVRSEFGSGETVVNERGRWEIRVTFPEAPYGETFRVTVGDDAGHQKRFEFVSYAER